VFFAQKSFFSENRKVYEIMWKNIVEPDRPQMAIWRTHIACWIHKVTDTHSGYVILIAFLPQQWFTNASQCSFIRTLPLLFLLVFLFSIEFS